MAGANESYVVELVVNVQQDAAIKSLLADMKKVTQQTGANGQLDKGIKNSVKGFKNLGYQVQNTSYQLTDFIVQVQGGVQPMRAFSQQAPQLLAGFGAFGAAVGVAAALLPALWVAFRNGERAVASFKDELADVGSAASGLTETLQTLDFNSWNEGFNEATKANRQFLVSMLDIKTFMLQGEIQQAMKALRTEVEALAEPSFWDTAIASLAMTGPGAGGAGAAAMTAPFGDLSLKDQIIDDAVIDNIRETYEVSEETANALQDLFEQFNTGQVQLDQFTSRMIEIGRNTKGATTEFYAFVEQLATAQNNMRLLAQAEEQRIAAAKALETGGLLPVEEKGSKNKLTMNDIRKETIKQLEAEVEANRKLRAVQIKQFNALEEVARGYRNALDPLHDYKVELEKIASVEDLLTDEERDNAIKQAQLKYGIIAEEIDYVAEGFKAFKSSFDTVVDGIADGTSSIKDVFTDMVKTLIKEFLKLAAYKGILTLLGGPNAEQGSFARIFGESSGILKQAHGGVWEGGLQRFANGGIVSSPTKFAHGGGFGLMGEAGPEAILPLTRGRNGDLGIAGAPVNVTVNNNAPGIDVSTSSVNGGLTIDIVAKAIAGQISQGGNQVSSAIERTYGVGRGAGAYT